MAQPRSKATRVWSEVSITLAVTDNPPQFLKFGFGHERKLRVGTQEDLRNVTRLVDDFNESEIERRLEKYKRIIQANQVDLEETSDSPTARARRRMREMQAEDALDQAEEDTWD